jgi:hypothetical protein
LYSTILFTQTLKPQPETVNPKPSTLSRMYSAIPFHDDVESIRYSIGVHVVAIFCGGLTLSAGVKTSWAALGQCSNDPFFRLSAFFTLLFLCSALLYQVCQYQ